MQARAYLLETLAEDGVVHADEAGGLVVDQRQVSWDALLTRQAVGLHARVLHDR